MAWSALPGDVATDQRAGRLIRECVDAYALWTLLWANGGYWGRFEDRPEQIYGRYGVEVERWSPQVIAELLRVLEEHGLIVRYTCEWTLRDVFALVDPDRPREGALEYCTHNGRHPWHKQLAWHKISPPPGWRAPRDLLKYLFEVEFGINPDTGKVRVWEGKEFTIECAQFGIEPHDFRGKDAWEAALGTVRGNIPWEPSSRMRAGADSNRNRDSEPQQGGGSAREAAEAYGDGSEGEAGRTASPPEERLALLGDGDGEGGTADGAESGLRRALRERLPRPRRLKQPEWEARLADWEAQLRGFATVYPQLCPLEKIIEQVRASPPVIGVDNTAFVWVHRVFPAVKARERGGDGKRGALNPSEDRPAEADWTGWKGGADDDAGAEGGGHHAGK